MSKVGGSREHSAHDTEGWIRVMVLGLIQNATAAGFEKKKAVVGFTKEYTDKNSRDFVYGFLRPSHL